MTTPKTARRRTFSTALLTASTLAVGALVFPTSASAAPEDQNEGMGWYSPADGGVHLSNSRTEVSRSDYAFVLGPAGKPDVKVVAGDWNGDGVTSTGWYNPADGSFHLTNALEASGAADYAFLSGPKGRTDIIPLAGDWDGDGRDSVGWYNPVDGSFHLSNSVAATSASDYAFTQGPANLPGISVVAGDWDGDGRDAVGWYKPADGSWNLSNSLTTTQTSDYAFAYGPSGDTAVRPVVGDWNGDGTTTAGWYNPRDGSFHLIDSHAAPTVVSDYAFVQGPPGQMNVLPLAGDWDGYTPPPPPTPPTPPTPSIPETTRVDLVLNFARAQLGKPYEWGASGPWTFDCSGLTMMSMRAAGVFMPRTSHQQYLKYGTIPLTNRAPGDLLFWDYQNDGKIDHVAIYLGSNTIIEAPVPGLNVRTRALSTSGLKSTVGRPLG